MTAYRNIPIPGTGKRKRYNPEKRDWKGRSYRKGGKRVREMLWHDVLEAVRAWMEAQR